MAIPDEYLKPGMYCRYRLSERRNKVDRHLWDITETTVEIVRVNAATVTIRLIHYPRLRLRSVDRDKLY